MMQRAAPKLSICIGTYNRADFIGATIDSIIAQATNECEIVISDNASTDNTEGVVSGYMSRFDRLRYVRQSTNRGMDQNFDCAVALARGEYCWLLSDDDLMKPRAVEMVLKALSGNPSVVMVNMEVTDFSASQVLQPRLLEIESDRVYGPTEMDRLFSDVQATRMIISNNIIKRTLWLSRERARYYGSLFIYTGVIFQEPLPADAIVIAEALVSFRQGNSNMYSPRMAEILFVNWPSVVSSLALSDSAKQRAASAQPWKNPRRLLLLRALGHYSLIEYRRWIRPRLTPIRKRLAALVVAMLPGAAVNMFYVLYSFAARDRGYMLHMMKQSRFYLLSWELFKRKS